VESECLLQIRPLAGDPDGATVRVQAAMRRPRRISTAVEALAVAQTRMRSRACFGRRFLNTPVKLHKARSEAIFVPPVPRL